MTVRGVCREPRCVGPVLLHSIHLPCAIIGRGLSKSIYATVAAGDTTGQAWQAGRPAAASSAASGGEQRGQWRRAGHTATVELGPVRGGEGRSLAVGAIGVGGFSALRSSPKDLFSSSSIVFFNVENIWIIN